MAPAETAVEKLDRLESQAVLTYRAFTGHVDGCDTCPADLSFQAMCGIGKARFITWSQAEAADNAWRRTINGLVAPLEPIAAEL